MRSNNGRAVEKTLSKGPNPSPELAVSRCTSPSPLPLAFSFIPELLFLSRIHSLSALNAKLEYSDYKGLFQSYYLSNTRSWSQQKRHRAGNLAEVEREREEGGGRVGAALCFSMKAGGACADLHKKSTCRTMAGGRAGGAGLRGPSRGEELVFEPPLPRPGPLLGARSRLRQLQVAGHQADAIERLPGLQRQ